MNRRLRIGRRLPDDGVADAAAVAAERHGADERSRFDAGHRAHALDRRLEEARDVGRRRVLARRPPELQREHVRRDRRRI